MQAHNPEINWETGKVKMTKCPLLYGRSNKKKEDKKTKREKRVATVRATRVELPEESSVL